MDDLYIQYLNGVDGVSHYEVHQLLGEYYLLKLYLLIINMRLKLFRKKKPVCGWVVCCWVDGCPVNGIAKRALTANK